MANWDGKYISPYAEHGKKSEQVKKITVSIPIKVLEILTNERTRRQLKSLRIFRLSARNRLTQNHHPARMVFILPNPYLL